MNPKRLGKIIQTVAVWLQKHTVFLRILEVPKGTYSVFYRSVWNRRS